MQIRKREANTVVLDANIDLVQAHRVLQPPPN